MAGHQASDAAIATAQPHEAQDIPQGPAITGGHVNAGRDGKAVEEDHPALDALPDSPGGLAPADILQDHNPVAPDHNARYTDSAARETAFLMHSILHTVMCCCPSVTLLQWQGCSSNGHVHAMQACRGHAPHPST